MLRVQRGECNVERPRGIVVFVSDEYRQTPRNARTTRDRGQLASGKGEIGAASGTATGVTVTVGVVHGRRRHDDGIGTSELFYR